MADRLANKNMPFDRCTMLYEIGIVVILAVEEEAEEDAWQVLGSEP